MTSIALRRGTAAAWTAANPVLLLGEPGLETDTLKWKVGDGSTAWTGLAYFNLGAGSIPDPSGEPDGEVLTTDTGAAVWATPTGGPPSGAAGGVLGGTYPDPSFAVDMATQAELDAVAGAAQPLDSDLTAIAALTTTSFGRSLLALADAAAGRTALALGTAAVAATGDFDAAGAAAAAQAASQPVDSDLTAIAALTTTSYGRAFLALADAAAGRAALGLGTLATQSGTVSGTSSGANTGDQTAATVPFTPTGTIASTDVQAAIAEVSGDVAAGTTPTGSAGGALDGTYPNPGLAASVAGDGLGETSDVLSVNVDGSTLEISADALRVKDAGITAAKLSASPTANDGKWLRLGTGALVWDSIDAADAAVADAGGYFAGSDVEAVLQEIGAAGGVGGFFGDGSDGPLSLTQTASAPAWAAKTGSGTSTTFTLNRDVYATTFDLDDSAGGFLVNTGNFRIFASTSLTVDSGVTVHNDGVAASGTTGGTNLAASVFSSGLAGSSGVAGGTGGAVGSSNPSIAVAQGTTVSSHGGVGGASTGGGTGGGAAGGTATLPVANGSPSNIVQIVSGRTLTAAVFSAGGGGRAGNAAASSTGGGGGAGGNIVGIYAAILINNGTIRAAGGHGGNASGTSNGGGGGGGGGGAVLLVYGATGSTRGTVTAPGGIGGNPVGTGAIGGTGQAGIVWSIVA